MGAITISILSTACAKELEKPASSPPTNAEFLELSEAQIHWYFFGAFQALGHAIHMQNEAQGRCVWEWYFDDVTAKQAKLIESMKRFPELSPTSIMIAHLERDCGKLPRGPESLQ